MSIQPAPAPYFTGTVTGTKDPDGLGRVEVQCDGFAKDKIELKTWMRLIQPFGSGEGKDKTVGIVCLPDIGDQVLVLRGHHDSPHHMIVLGVLNHSKNKPPAVLYDKAKNQKRGLTTPSGHTVLFDDKEEQISIYTKEKAVSIVLDNKKQTITITAAKKDILIEAKGKVTIKAKDADVDLKGNATVKAKNITVEGKGPIKLTGKGVTIESKAALKIKGKAITVSGKPIKLN